MGTWLIRPATPSDRDGVEAVLTAAYSTLLRGYYAPAVLEAALPIITQASLILLSSGCYHVAADATGAILACGGWSEARPGTGERQDGRGHIRRFATHPDACRLGLGRSIFSTCARQAETAGIRVLECYSSLAATAFYAALGFRAERPITVQLPAGVPFPAVVMTYHRAAGE